MTSRGLQFWILLITSSAVSLLMVSQIFISHAIIREQHTLVDSHETADSGPTYKAAWEKLAVSVWEASAHDPALLDLLKSEGIGVHQGKASGAASSTPADSSAPQATNAAPVPSVTSKPESALTPVAP